MKSVRFPLLGFPDVVLHADETTVKQHLDYAAAKSGDIEAADRLVAATLNPTSVERIAKVLAGASALLVPIHALETTGVNEIPAAMARALSGRLGCRIHEDIAQVNTVGHTGADGYHRMAHQALFGGAVQSGARYVLVDDFVGQGGTLANIYGHILSRGGTVIGATALTGKPYSAILAPTSEQLQSLRNKHGQALEAWWQAEFTHGFGELTRSEARYLENSADADTVRSRIAAARLKTSHPSSA